MGGFDACSEVYAWPRSGRVCAPKASGLEEDTRVAGALAGSVKKMFEQSLSLSLSLSPYPISIY